MPSITDWLMVGITAVYVIATVAICFANFKSAKATREQIAESQRQFEELSRAFVTVNFEIIRNGLFVLHIHNCGKRIATNVRIELPSEFINNMPEAWDKRHLSILKDSVFTLGIDQSLYIGMGASPQLKQISEQILDIALSYEDTARKYNERITIDLAQYFWALVYESPVEDARQELKSIAKSMKDMVRTSKTIEQHLHLNDSDSRSNILRAENNPLL